MVVRNQYAVNNAAKAKAQLARDIALEPTFTYYVLPRDLFDQVQGEHWTFVDLASECDVRGIPPIRCKKRETQQKVSVPIGYAAVYEGQPGVIFVAQQNW